MIGGTTREIYHYQWHIDKDDTEQDYILTDMPGFNEQFAELDILAAEEVQRAHIAIYLCDGDLTASQFNELKAILLLKKPCIVAINKSDRYNNEDRQLIISQIQQRIDTLRQDSGYNHLAIARESLTYLLHDKRVPEQLRESLRDDFQQVEKMLEKIEHEHIHISVLGRVSVGKSSLLKALIDKEQFSTSPLHGETRHHAFTNWHEYEEGGVYFIDTPGINEIEGEQRARMAHEVASRSDIILFVVDSDMTDTEYQALKSVLSESRPVVLVLNKVDRYTKKEQETLLSSLAHRVSGLVDAENIVLATSRTTEKHYLLVDEEGNETETRKEFPPDVTALKNCLWSIVKDEGKTLAAINASLFAGDLSDQVIERIMSVRKDVAAKLIHAYCVSKVI